MDGIQANLFLYLTGVRCATFRSWVKIRKMISELLFGLLGIFVGGFLGNRFALGRDKRKEFNEISDSLFKRLEQQREIIRKGAFPHDANELDWSSFIDLARRVPFYKRRKLSKAVEHYIQAKQNCGHFENGRYILSKPEVMLKAISTLQKFLPHK